MVTKEADLFEDVDLENLEIDPNWGTGRHRAIVPDSGRNRSRRLSSRIGSAAPLFAEGEKDEKDIVDIFIDDLLRYWKRKFQEYPIIKLDGFGGNAYDFAKHSILGWACDALTPENPTGTFGRIAKAVLGGWEGTYR